MANVHLFEVQLEWTGNQGKGTQHYTGYSRDHIIRAEGRPDISCSADPVFRGNAARYNPEQLLVASLASCHMLWYLHLCANAKIVVDAYRDNPSGTLLEEADGSGRFKEVVLHPEVTVRDPSWIARANELHTQAHELCFIARSCNFPVHHFPVCRAGSTGV
ncbi:MAG TPA: OsmC family protein [Chitinophagaceae bacterium]|nr:OsmC family protein [Chitinophagaceae bacterium]